MTWLEDTLVGVVNNSSQPIRALGLRAFNLPIFAFDGDGLVDFGIPGNFRDPTGYGGPNAYFSNTFPNPTSGVVNFIAPIPPGQTDYFALEENIRSAVSCQQVINNALSPLVGIGTPQISTTFTPNLGLSLFEAAPICGFVVFDWQQAITNLPAPSPYFQIGNPTTPLTAPPPFLDPPPGGYRTHGIDQPDDSYPFYYNFRDGELTKNETTPSTLRFFDDATNPCLPGGAAADCGGNTAPPGSFMGFHTQLVGVGSDGSPVYLGIGFSWKTTFNGTSGGTATTKNALPPDPGSGTGGVTVTSIQTETGYQYNGMTVTSVNGRPVPMSSAAIQFKPPAAAPAPINPGSRGVIPVAILSTAMLAASDIDSTSVRFGPDNAGNVTPTSLQDVNDDGQPDLILHFRTNETGLACSDVAALLTGKTVAGQTFAGSEGIVAVGCK